MRNRAQKTLEKLKKDEDRLDPTKGNQGLKRISPQARRKSNIDYLFLQDKLLARLAEIARTALFAHSVVFLTLDSDGRSLKVDAFASEDGVDIDINTRIILEESLFSLAALKKQPVTYAKLPIKDIPSYYTGRSEIQSLIMVPFFKGDRLEGFIVADSVQQNHFGQDEAGYLILVGEQVVENMDKIKLIRHTLHEREQFAAFYEVANRVSSALKIEDVLKVVLTATSAIVHYDAAALSLVDEENPEKSLIYDVYNLDQEALKGKSFGHNEGHVGWVTHLRTYLAHSDVTKAQRPVFSATLRIKGAKSMLCLPLINQDRAVGALTFFWKKENTLEEGDRKILEVLAIQASASLENARMYQQMEKMAITDGLTGLHNHRYFKEWLQNEIHRAGRMPINISLILMDIDHFKGVNDTYGHPVGDLVLKKVSAILSDSIRTIDLAVRYGGEEFVLVLLDTNAKGAQKMANRIRKEIQGTKIDFPKGSLKVTISMGVSTFPENAEHVQPLIDVADKALYFSKENGRNQVTHCNQLPKS